MPNLMLVISSAFAAGIWCAGLYAWPLTLLYYIAAVSIGVLIWSATREKQLAVRMLAVVFFVAGMIRFIHADALSPVDISRFAGQTVTVYGTVADIPKISQLDAQTEKVQYVIAAKNIKLEQQSSLMPAAGGIIINTSKPEREVVAHYGDKVVVSGKVMLPHGYHNPGMVDTVAALKRQGITAKMVVPAGMVVIQKKVEQSWRTILAAWRDRVKADMLKVMPAGDAAVLNGMIFGGYDGIRQDLIHDFANTGIIHILSVSGTHIALLAGAILWLGTRLGLRYNITVAVAVVSIMAYGVVSGLTPPVVRSIIMGLMALAALGLDREKDAPSALAAAALGMLAYQPGLIYDISFQLSCGATAGLVFFYHKTFATLSFLPGWLAGALAAVWAAQLGVLPFIAWYFSSFSFSAFIANIIVVPIVELIVILGLLGVMTVTVFQMAGNILLVVCSQLIGGVAWLTSLLAGLPGGTVYLPPIGVFGGILYYVVVAWSYGYCPKGMLSPREIMKRWPHQTCLASLLLAAVVMIYVWYPRPVYVHFIDVGQGDATLITTPHGRAILVDTGGNRKEATNFDVGDRVVLPYLKHYGVRELDYLFLTHGHQDHAGGAQAIVVRIPVRRIVLAREEYTPAVKDLVRTVQGRGIIPAFAGQSMVLDGVAVDVVYADRDSRTRLGNETSVVLRVSYGKHSFLITGDLEGEAEAALISRGLSPSTVLKVGHHGALKSSTPAFLKAVSPEYAVISVGRNNSYGHPHSSTMERLTSRNIKMYRTDRDGAIVFKTDGVVLAVDNFIK